MSSSLQYRTNRRAVVSSLAPLPGFSGSLLTVQASAQTTSGRPLPSWNDGASKQAILDFVRATTDAASPK